MKAKADQPIYRLKRKILFVAVAILLWMIDFALKIASYKRVTTILFRLSPNPDPKVQNYKLAFQWGGIVNGVAARRVMQASCLRRTLAAWWLLRWKRIPSDIRIGVNMTSGHAWLEHHGYIVNDHPEVNKHFPIIYTDELTPERLAQIT